MSSIQFYLPVFSAKSQWINLLINFPGNRLIENNEKF